MVTVDFTKAVAITHQSRQLLHEEKTREYFKTLSNNMARLEFMSAGTEKDALLTATQDVHALVEACVDEDETLRSDIDAVTTDDLVALEALLVSIENQISALSGTTY